MTAFFWISYGLLWIICSVTLIAVILLFRQFGLLSMAPRQRIGLGGISLGSQLPSASVEAQRAGTTGTSDAAVGSITEIWSYGESASQLATLVLGGPECPICKELWPAVAQLPKHRPESSWIWIDGARRAGEVPPGWTYAVSPDLEVHRLYEVPMMPFAYVVERSSGKVVAKGLVNRTEDLVDLLEEAVLKTAGRANVQLGAAR